MGNQETRKSGPQISLEAARALLADPLPIARSHRHDAKMARVRRGEESISRLEQRDLIYLLGGARQYSPVQRILAPVGHDDHWTDCSGCAEFECAVMGLQLRNPAGWTGTLVTEGRQGTSPYFTLMLKEPEQTEGHVIMRFRHHPGFLHREGAAKWRWAECGGIDNPTAGGGPTWFHPTDERIAEFPYHRHFEALS